MSHLDASRPCVRVASDCGVRGAHRRCREGSCQRCLGSRGRSGERCFAVARLVNSRPHGFETGRNSRALRLAAIDIGSNSIKLIVVEATSDDSFAVLGREKEVVRLGHNTLREGYLSPDTIERAVDCIGRFRSISEARGATQVLAVATASVREAHNASEFIEEVEKRTGVRIEVLLKY